LLVSLIDLLEAFIKRDKPQDKVSPHLTGVVRKNCLALGDTPLTNGAAVKAELLNILPIIKDATRELEEIKSSNQGSEDKDEEDEWETEELSQEMTQMVPIIVTLFKCSFSLIKKVSELIESVEENNVDQWDSLVENSKKLEALVDQLGSSIYDEDLKDTISLGKSLVDSNLSLVGAVRGAHFKLETNQVEMTNKFLDLLENKIKQTLEELVEKGKK